MAYLQPRSPPPFVYPRGSFKMIPNLARKKSAVGVIEFIEFRKEKVRDNEEGGENHRALS